MNRRCEKTAWTEEENNAIYEYFRRHIKLKEIPKKVECVAAKEKYACLQNRTWTIIKSKVKNIINKKEQIE